MDRASEVEKSVEREKERAAMDGMDGRVEFVLSRKSCVTAVALRQ